MSKLGPSPLFSTSPLPGIELYHLHFAIQPPGPAQRSPIGKVAERSFLHALEHRVDLEVLGHSIQVQGEQRTLGELDFLIRDKQRGLVHIEYVYKYYLYIPWMGADALGHWIGPNFKDRLHYKLAHLREHQFPLLNTETCRGLLQESYGIGPSEPIDQWMSFYAELYLPYSDTELQWHQGLNKGCVRGHWIFLEQFRKLSLTQDVEYFVCSKQDWLSHQSPAQAWLDHAEAIHSVEDSLRRGHSPMLWRRGGDEIQRLFIIPDRAIEQR